jgi:hypothetical protein
MEYLTITPSPWFLFRLSRLLTLAINLFKKATVRKNEPIITAGENLGAKHAQSNHQIS